MAEHASVSMGRLMIGALGILTALALAATQAGEPQYRRVSLRRCQCFTGLLLLLMGYLGSASAGLVSSPPSACGVPQRITPDSNDGIGLTIATCPGPDGTGLIEVRSDVSGTVRDVFQIAYESIAFVLDVDNRRDLNGDGFPIFRS